MQKINRIHIAKTPYEIEVTAQELLSKYLSDLRSYAVDPDILLDIEVRITEILAERKVVAGSVITESDITAIKAQLGEPSDFASDDIAANISETKQDTKRVLYRDVDTAIIGGVMSGMAKYLRISTSVARLLFLFILIVSFGTATLAYLLFWVIMPPAKSAADKLKLMGRLVTAESIKAYNASEHERNSIQEAAARARRIVAICVGIIALLGALSVAFFTIKWAFGMYTYVMHITTYNNELNWAYWTALGLAIVSGVLLMLLCIQFAMAAFRRRFSRGLIVTMIAVTVAGCLSFGAAAALVYFGSNESDRRYQAALVDRTIPLPANAANATNLTASGYGLDVVYVVSDQVSAVMQTLPNQPTPKISMDGKTLKIAEPDTISANNGYDYYAHRTLTIYGPKLSNITSRSSSVTYNAGTIPSELNAIANDSGTIVLTGGEFTKLVSRADTSASIDGSDAAVTAAEVTVLGSASTSLGSVQSLFVSQPVSCSRSQMTNILVREINNPNMIINGVEAPKASVSTSCSVIDIDDDDLNEY